MATSTITKTPTAWTISPSLSKNGTFTVPNAEGKEIYISGNTNTYNNTGGFLPPFSIITTGTYFRLGSRAMITVYLTKSGNDLVVRYEAYDDISGVDVTASIPITVSYR